jgi:hypothetical protein
MTYVWRASLGTWVIRPGIVGDKWALVWFDQNQRQLQARHFPDPQSAVDAVVQKNTGVPHWDSAIGMSYGKEKLASWETANQFP